MFVQYSWQLLFSPKRTHVDANIRLKVWPFHLVHLGFSQLQKEEAGGKSTHLIKLLLVVIYAEGCESNSSWDRCFFALPGELKEQQIGLSRIQAGKWWCPRPSLKLGQQFGHWYGTKCLGKVTGFVFSLWKPGEIGKLDVVTAWKYFLLGCCWTCLNEPVGKNESLSDSYSWQFVGWGHRLWHGL